MTSASTNPSSTTSRAEGLAKRPKHTEKELAKLVKELELNLKQSPFSKRRNGRCARSMRKTTRCWKKTSAPTTASPKTLTILLSTSLIHKCVTAQWRITEAEVRHTISRTAELTGTG